MKASVTKCLDIFRWEGWSWQAGASVTNLFVGRFGGSDEIAGTVAFLCSQDSSYLTGESIAVAGGFYSRLWSATIIHCWLCFVEVLSWLQGFLHGIKSWSLHRNRDIFQKEKVVKNLSNRFAWINQIFIPCWWTFLEMQSNSCGCLHVSNLIVVNWVVTHAAPIGSWSFERCFIKTRQLIKVPVESLGYLNAWKLRLLSFVYLLNIYASPFLNMIEIAPEFLLVLLIEVENEGICGFCTVHQSHGVFIWSPEVANILSLNSRNDLWD